jgi:hypothetical protein
MPIIRIDQRLVSSNLPIPDFMEGEHISGVAASPRKLRSSKKPSIARVFGCLGAGGSFADSGGYSPGRRFPAGLPRHTATRVTQRTRRAVQMNAAKHQPMTFESVGPTVVGTLGVLVTLVAASTVWLFLTSPAVVATSTTPGTFSPLVSDIADVLLRSFEALLRLL